MIDKVRLTLRFPGDEDAIDVSHLVIDRSVRIDRLFCSDDFRSAVDTFSCSLKHNTNIVRKLRLATDRIILTVRDYATDAPLFHGAIEPNASQSIGQFVEHVEIEAVDNSWRLDEPIRESVTIPEAIGLSGYFLYNSHFPEQSLVHFLLLKAGYISDEIAFGEVTEIVSYCSAKKGEETYREILDDVLSEYGYVLTVDNAGVFAIKPWRTEGEAYDFELGPADLSAVMPVTWNKTAEYRDGAKVVWSEPSVIEDALVYRDSLPLSSDGQFEGKAIAAGDYYPSDADIQEVYQDFVESWLDLPYLSRSTRLKNKDLSLITTSDHEVLFSADPGIELDLEEFEGLRARVRFRNTSDAIARIYVFEIHAKALIRLAERNVLAPDGATNPKEYSSRFLFENEPAVNLAKALAVGVAFADFKYSFALNRELQPGCIVRLIEPRTELDTLAMVQGGVLSQGSPTTQYSAIAVTDPEGLTYREWANLVTSGWLATQTTQKEIEGAIGSFNVIPADVSGLTAKAGRDSIILTWTSVTGSTVRAAADAYILQRSTDNGSSWYDCEGSLDGHSRISSNIFAWAFDRVSDGYPEIASSLSYGCPGLDAYRFRVKAISATGRTSLNWSILTLVDTSEYGTWLPGEPTGCVGSSAGRSVKVDWNDSNVYGLLRYELQIALDSADPTWYKPALGLDPLGSEDNYRQSALVADKRQVTISQFTHDLPLSGQNDGPPDPRDTAYIYRLRIVSDRTWNDTEIGLYEKTSDGKTAGPWSITIPVLARATGAYDIVQRSIGRSQLALGSIFSEHMSAKNLSSVFAYIAALSGGVEDEYNTWILNDYPGRTKAIGYFRVGGMNVGIEYNPATGKFRIMGVNVELTESDLSTYEQGVTDPKRQTLENLGLVVKDSDANLNVELVRLGYEEASGLWGGEKLGGLVHHIDDEDIDTPFLEPAGGGVVKKETDSYGPKYTLFDGTILRPSPLQYFQLPGMPSPSEVYGGTWNNISASYAGAFFRVEGGSASEFGAGLQEAQNLLHSHTESTNTHQHSVTGPSQYTTREPGSNSYVFWAGTGGTFYTSTYSHSHTLSSEGGSDLRPINYTIRIWERIA